jgi:metal-responsive CopG/Arc/MetJ family transcriptional regulator
MSRMVAVRLDERLLATVDRERRRARVTRAKVIHDALAMWVERRRVEEAVRREQEGYARKPIGEGEFGSVLGAQAWPK